MSQYTFTEKIKNINNEISNTSANLNEKYISYNIFLKTLSFNNEVMNHIDTKIQLINSEINSYNNELNYNSMPNENNMNLLFLLKEANNTLNVLKKTKDDQNTTINTYENHVYNTNLQIQILNTYLEDLNKMRDRIERWDNIENQNDNDRKRESYKNNIGFERQLKYINALL
tara:strand:- start:494 stop:1009 length:516 start_codon:yes stop_codon:yes gene_type:complete